ncbi:MAG TPA: hypothetical protein VMV54_01810 [Acidocella sp.]|nr:hypothetical protein [Acidocella sp.]
MNRNSKIKIKAIAFCVLAAASLASWPASAETTTLVCRIPTGDMAGQLFKIIIDFDASTVSEPLYGDVGNPFQDHPAKISDSTITFDGTGSKEGKEGNGTRRPMWLDRVTGELHSRVCDRTACSGDWIVTCHKAEKQF